MELKLTGLSQADNLFYTLVLNDIFEALFGESGLPPLRSEVITIHRCPTFATPRYVSNSDNELIHVNSGENRPWQFGYQVAHEFGHLSARADVRHPRDDGHMWIEEALCECYSLIAMSCLAEKPSPRFDGAREYLATLLAQYADFEVSPSWFSSEIDKLKKAKTITEEAQRIAHYLFHNVPRARIISDNHLIRQLPTGGTLNEYLSAWQKRSGDGISVPSLLLDITRG